MVSTWDIGGACTAIEKRPRTDEALLSLVPLDCCIDIPLGLLNGRRPRYCP